MWFRQIRHEYLLPVEMSSLFDKYLKLSREYYTDFSGVEEIKEERTYENVGEE